MRLNLGCGEFTATGWHNVDSEHCPHDVDERVDLAGPLPWPAKSVECAYLAHVLEHLTLPEARRLLTALRKTLTPGGPVMVVGPDVHRARTMHEAGRISDQEMDGVISGGGRWAGDVHQWECDAPTLVELLTKTGYVDVTEVPISEVDGDRWPLVSRIGWQAAVAATAPAAAPTPRTRKPRSHTTTATPAGE